MTPLLAAALFWQLEDRSMIARNVTQSAGERRNGDRTFSSADYPETLAPTVNENRLSSHSKVMVIHVFP